MAGNRRSLDDERGNLTIVFCRLVAAKNPAAVLWENVPGVLSTEDNAFGCFLSGLLDEEEPLLPSDGTTRWPNAGHVVGAKASIAWRVLDAQYFGLAQQRRRVFLVRCPRGGADPAKILFECEGVRRDSPPGREKAKVVTAALTRGFGSGGADDNDARQGFLVASTGDRAHCLNGGGMGRLDYETETLIAHSLRGEGHDASEDGTGRGIPLVVGAIDAHIEEKWGCNQWVNQGHWVVRNGVRRLTPLECERLQGFPDGWTALGKDGSRYRAIGNSMAVPVVRWILERIRKADAP